MAPLTKAAVVEALVRHLESELASITAMATMAADEATSQESKSEGKYDTRSTEASYLARGQAERVGALRSALAQANALPTTPADTDRPIGVGRLVLLEDGQERSRWMFLVGEGGGTSLTVGGEAVRVVSLVSPLGRAMLGAGLDDDIEVEVGGRTQTWTVLQAR